jgi:hypothetical protein
MIVYEKTNHHISSLSVQLSAQNNDPNPHFPKVKISGPCNQQFLDNYKGKWLTHDPTLSPISVNDYHDEVMKRLNAINALIRQIYPEPTSADAGWVGEFAKTSFADEVKFVPCRRSGSGRDKNQDQCCL